MKALGLDYGERRIGIAVSDGAGSMAFPRRALGRTTLDKDLAAILRVVREEVVERIVVGLPRSLDGSIGGQAKRVQEFVSALQQLSDVPVETWDERFSTFEATEAMRQAGVQPSRNKGRVDAAAAALILQRWLDHQRAQRPA
ncbi:MAG: Holliday junction resolvase RuvX [Dehalococcoidia bacterium]|nr:Holliday junction resolvase RuvX [Dehalococcoidia bacterium]